jgi:hypothetical protein
MGVTAACGKVAASKHGFSFGGKVAWWRIVMAQEV